MRPQIITPPLLFLFLATALWLTAGACSTSKAHAEGWPGERRSLSTAEVGQFFKTSALRSGDAFGRLRVSEPVIEGDLKFTADLLPLRVGVIATGGATVVHASPLPQARLRVNAANQRGLLRTYEHFRYRAAQSQLVKMTGVMGAPTNDVEVRMGYFSDSDGLFLAQTRVGPQIVIRSSVTGVVVETRIDQEDWNLDTLLDPKYLTLDLSKGVVFAIDFQYLGHGAVRFGFDLGEGGTHWVHQEKHSGLTVNPYMKSGSQPMSWEIISSAAYAGGNRDLFATCGSVVREGGAEEPGAAGSVNTGLTAVAVPVADAAGEVHLLLRRKAGYAHAALRPISVECINTGGNPLRGQLLLKPTLGGAAPVWVGVAGGAAIGEVSTTAGMTATGGIPLAAFYVPASAVASRGTVQLQDVARTLPLVADLAGASDILALELNQVGGATTALCQLTWEALQ